MSEELKIFLAALATCPALAVVFAFAAACNDTFVDFKDALAFTGAIWTILSGLVVIVGGMYFIWTWAL